MVYVYFGLGGFDKAVEFVQYFSGDSFLNPLTDKEKVSLIMAKVTFEPDCRDNWHIHHAKTGGGQILLVTARRGYYQEWGRTARELKPGDTVMIEPGGKYWHGAASDSWFAHLAMEIPGKANQNEWCDEVSDETYNLLKEEG